jgi:methylenetetrahydrofolate--tRNA-(uracil-5-)-methyltransferase
MGALARYVSGAETKNYQPVNITFALLEPLPEDVRRQVRGKRERHHIQVELALKEWNAWLHDNNLATNLSQASPHEKIPGIAQVA